jgi:choline kinase
VAALAGCGLTATDRGANLERLLAAPGDLVSAVDSRADFADHDDATRVRYENGTIAQIDKRSRLRRA